MKLQGYIEIEKTNKKTGVTKIERYNTVTDLGRAWFLANSAGLLQFPANVARGTFYPCSSATELYDQYTSNSAAGRFNLNQDKTIGLALINSAEELTAESSHMPILKNDGTVDGSKLAAYGRTRKVPASGKEGAWVPIREADMIDDFAIANRWLFSDEMVFTFNKMAIGAGFAGDDPQGFGVWKGIDSTFNTADGGTSATRYSQYFLPPGVSGKTSATEILLSTAKNTNIGKADASYDFVTGKLTLLVSDDPRFNATLISTTSLTCVTAAGELYYSVDGSSNVNRYSDNYQYSTAGSVRGMMYEKEKNEIWTVSQGRYSGGILSKFSLTSNSVTETVDFSDTYFPASIRGASNTLMEGGQITKLPNGNYELRSKAYGYLKTGIVVECSDIMNIGATIQKIYFDGALDNVHTYRIAERDIKITSDVKAGVVSHFGVDDNSANRKFALKFRDEKFGGNMLSFVNFDVPVEKTNEETLQITYGYKII